MISGDKRLTTQDCRFISEIEAEETEKAMNEARKNKGIVKEKEQKERRSGYAKDLDLSADLF